jgi:hypothetical protein
MATYAQTDLRIGKKDGEVVHIAAGEKVTQSSGLSKEQVKELVDAGSLGTEPPAGTEAAESEPLDDDVRTVDDPSPAAQSGPETTPAPSEGGPTSPEEAQKQSKK